MTSHDLVNYTNKKDILRTKRLSIINKKKIIQIKRYTANKGNKIRL